MSKREGKRKQAERRGVLADHQRRGKRLLPPFVHLLGGFHEFAWVDRPLPELLWLGLLHKSYGFERGSELATDLAKTAATVSGSKVFFGTISAYTTLDRYQQGRLVRLSEEIGVGEPVRLAIADLLSLYPACPLKTIYRVDRPAGDGASARERLKEALEPLFYRHERPATLIAGTMIGIGLETGRIVAYSGSSLRDWRILADYPKTDASRRVGGACRAAVNAAFMEPLYDMRWEWPRYFWDRGLELEPCAIEPPLLGDE